MTSPEPDEFIDQVEQEPELVNPTLRRLIPWLVVVALAILFLPLYTISTTLGADAVRLQTELENLQIRLTSEPTPLPEVQQLEQEWTAIQTQLNELEAIYADLISSHTNWPAIVGAIRNYDPGEILLASLEQPSANRILLLGTAIDDTAVSDYARSLEETNLFERVAIQSISLSTSTDGLPGPTVAATAILTATQTSTPTPDLGDEFEKDDIIPMPIFLGQIQTHSFYPRSDVDSVAFLAKAGRFYRIVTDNLSPGVDTFLSVSFDSTALTNDDSEAGTLASEITFQMIPDRDTEVVVKVSNRGQYGPNMLYTLLVEEFLPTPLPTHTATSTPLPSATPAPTSTPQIINTPTATPDLRDAYEPDDVNAKAIGVGELQTHNFYPNGDIDKISFLVKQGRHYQVATSNLAIGVDTMLTVQFGTQQWTNDDYEPQGSGNLASAVCFSVAADGLVVATITNLSQQYGANRTYDATMAEVPELRTNVNQLSYGPVAAGGANPNPQAVTITSGSPTPWTARKNANWLTLNPDNGTTPSTMSVSIDISGLAAGTYTDTVTVAWASVCRRQITVTLQVVQTIPLVLSEAQIFAVAPAGAPEKNGRLRQLVKTDLVALQRGPVDFVIVLDLRADSQ